MDDYSLLDDDHELLRSQVAHVASMLRLLNTGLTALATAILEATRQSELLDNQLREHFAFEEAVVFPFIRSKYPGMVVELHDLISQHDIMNRTMETLLATLKQPSYDQDETLTILNAFEAEFEHHASVEERLFKVLGDRIRTEDR